MQNGSNIKQVLYYLLSGLTIFVLTFPGYQPAYGTGLDPSYVWALNYLFVHDYQTLTQLTYPIGPWGFLKYAAAYGPNLAIALSVFSVIKFGFILGMLRFMASHRKLFDPVGLVIVLIASYFAGFDYALVGSVVLLLLLQLDKKGTLLFFALANILAAIGLMVKTAIGITAYSILFAYFFLYLVLLKPTLKNLLMKLAISLLILLVVGWFAFGNLLTFFQSVIGTFHLAGGYASGLALFPENNWWLLSGFILVVLSFPFFPGARESRSTWVLLLLPLFAIWKLAMGREDVYHYAAIIGFLVVYWSILLLSMKRIRALALFFPLLSLFLVLLNFRNVPGHGEYRLQFNGPYNFYEAVLNYQEFNERYKAISQNNIRANKLDPEFRQYIGENGIDIYPWDLSYAAANQLEWRPRKTLEIGASTSAWASRLSASHFEGELSPDMVLFHLQNDRWGGRLGSLDRRYLLNDEPKVMENLFRYYTLSKKANGLLLFEKKKGTENGVVTEMIPEQDAGWNRWIELPPHPGDLLRLKVEIGKSFLGSIKTFLYKDEAYFIDYQFTDGRVHTYRLLAATAVDGIWVDPLVSDPVDNRVNDVSKVRFRCSNDRMVKDDILLNWESVRPVSNDPANTYLWERNLFSPSYLLRSTLSHTSESVGWQVKTGQLVSVDNRNAVEEVGSKGYSSSFRVLVDSLTNDTVTNLLVEVGVNYRFRDQPDEGALLVIGVEGASEPLWRARALDVSLVAESWNYAFNTVELDALQHSGGELYVYLWNNGNATVLIDEFRVAIQAKK